MILQYNIGGGSMGVAKETDLREITKALSGFDKEGLLLIKSNISVLKAYQDMKKKESSQRAN